ncbi:hypothetical protein [Streptomyces sp. NPDC002054]|uniref:hypothetical protein n=1 Tax=Streptomyces sp. NPDC002054 TaxID=3154663 RepID=UPI003316A423
MGAIRSSATALLAAGATAAAGAVLVLSTSATGPDTDPAGGPPAARKVTFGFAIIPSTVEPGGTTELSVTACDAAFATVSSGVFDSVSIPRGQTVRVTIDRDARRGAQYSVAFTCNGETGSADLTIAGGVSMPTAQSTATDRPAANALPRTTTGAKETTGPTEPTRTTPTTGTTDTTRTTRAAAGTTPAATLGVRGGVGGSVAGLDPAEIGAGAVLVLAAVAGTAYAVHRRNASTAGPTRKH